MTSGNSFVYRHIRPDTNEVFYIGAGTYQKKWKYERALTHKTRNKHWHNIVRKNGGQFKVEIIFDEISKEDAINKEIEFIALYGRSEFGLGTLCNLTIGGDGVMGISEETKKKIGDSRRGKPGPKQFEETIRKRALKLTGSGNPWFGKKFSKEYRKKLSDAKKGRKVPREVVEKTRAANKGKKRSKKFCARMKECAIQQAEMRRQRALLQWAARKAAGFKRLTD